MCLAFVVLCLAAGPATLHAQEATPAAADQPAEAGGGDVPSFTAAQVRKGTAAYRDTCAGCHGMQLEGYQESPPLKGAAFDADWSGHTVEDFYQFISTSMPLTAPGSLTPDKYVAIIAYLLKEYGIKAGETELPSDPQKMANMVMPSATQ